MTLNLRGMREAAGLSQGEVGRRLALSQAQISRYETDPESISMEIARRWSEECGTTLEVEMYKAAQRDAAQKDGGLEVGEPYLEFNQRLALLEQYIESSPAVNISVGPVSFSPEDLRAKIREWKQKPTVLIAGRFDSGKTRIANALLGGNRLPSQYQPTTSVATFIRHESERPKWQKEDVWIMGTDFTPTMWGDERYCQKHRVSSGGFEALRRFGIKESEGESLGAKYALIYMNAPILHACTLIDVPGYSDQLAEEQIANSSASTADVLIYTAPANGFLDSADFMRLALLLRSIPNFPADAEKDIEKLSNLFIVATHADHKFEDGELESILDTGSKRFYRHLKDSIFADRHITEQDLRARFRTFWYEAPKRRAALETGIRHTLSKVMPIQLERHVNTEIKAIKRKTKRSLTSQISAYERTRSECEAASKALVLMREYEPDFRKRIRAKKEEVGALIRTLREESIAFVDSEITEMVTVTSIVEFIRKEFANKKGDAKRDAVAKLLEDTQSKLEKFLEGESRKVNSAIDDLLKEYSESLGRFESPEIASFGIPFDSAAAFASGLAGIGTLGALSIWASMMGNLGGYILVAKLASVLSAVGLGVGSATLVTFVAAIGGPVTLAIGLASLLTLGIWRFLTGPWEYTLAKKIAKTMEEKQLIAKYKGGVTEFWEQTWIAFQAGADALDNKFTQYLSTNEELVDATKGGSKEKIEAVIELLKELRDFFAKVPWRSPV